MKSPNERNKEVLDELITRSGAFTAMLVSKEGYSLANAGDVSYLNTTALAALVAGMFSATREVANMVGEKQFSILLQQGKTRHIHISLIGDATMMVVVFEDQQRIGKVRLEAQHAADQIFKLLSMPIPAERKGELGTPHFKEYALQLIDKIFSPSS
jgi:predicted regulator of Ras-like GTPase activity (Roadblock/LC7/MglB family)